MPSQNFKEHEEEVGLNGVPEIVGKLVESHVTVLHIGYQSRELLLHALCSNSGSQRRTRWQAPSSGRLQAEPDTDAQAYSRERRDDVLLLHHRQAFFSCDSRFSGGAWNPCRDDEDLKERTGKTKILKEREGQGRHGRT